MQEVGGSIPPGSTSLRRLRLLRLGKPYRSEGYRVIARTAKTGSASAAVAFAPARGHYSPNAAFNRSRRAISSFFIADNSVTEQAEAARMAWGTALAFSRSA